MKRWIPSKKEEKEWQQYQELMKVDEELNFKLIEAKRLMYSYTDRDSEFGQLIPYHENMPALFCILNIKCKFDYNCKFCNDRNICFKLSTEKHLRHLLKSQKHCSIQDFFEKDLNLNEIMAAKTKLFKEIFLSWVK